MAKDIMAGFELYQPAQLSEAFALLDRFGKDAWKLAGGYDSLSWLKERNKSPKAVIDRLLLAVEARLSAAGINGIPEVAQLAELADMRTSEAVDRLLLVTDQEQARTRRTLAHEEADQTGLDRAHLLRLIDAQPIASQGLAVPLEIKEVTAARALSKDAARSFD